MAAPEESLDLDPIEPVDADEPKPKKSKAKGTKTRTDEDDEPKARRDKRARDEDDEAKEQKSKRDKRARDEDGEADRAKEQKAKRDKRDRDETDAKAEKAKSKRAAPRGDEDDEDEPRRKPPKLGNRKVPYPPPPANVPEDLTEYAESYVRQENRLLISLFLFLAFYIGAVLFSLLIGVWCVYSLWHWFPVKVIGIIFSSVFFLFLVKGFFKGAPIDRDMSFEITEDDHPVLFEFIYRLCEEVGSPLPNKVLVAPDVNAMCITNVSVFSLFKEPKKDLLIGLGLVNAINMSEFKAILAHEFGHFCQAGSTRSYTYIAQSVILDMIRGEDWFDRMIKNLKASKQFRGLGMALGGPLWLWREVLAKVFNMIALQSKVVSREREFHADLVAVSAAGSDSATHGLLRARFGMDCLIQAVHDLTTAMDHKMYSTDLYLHQSRAAAVVRRKKKDPFLGLPPAIGPEGGKKVRVFDAEQDALEDEDRTPPMWRSHPADADREENVKKEYVAAAIDHRSPWILFDNPADLKERMTYKFYRMHRAFRIPKNADLTDAQKVQTFIDNEHSDTTYDPKYNGIYDDRPLEPVAPNKDGTPGDLAELNRLVVEKPWTDDRIEKVLEKLYEGCRAKAEELDELRKERALLDNTPGKKSSRLKKKIKAIDEKLDVLWEWLRSLDRRVYLIHVQMAGTVSADSKDELIERYRFQLEVQRLYSISRYHQERALAFARLLFSLPPDRIHPELGTEVMSILREAWRALKKIIQTAREINLPAMKNFEEGESLADFILEGKMVPEPPLSYVKLDWCQKLVDQLAAVRAKCFRLHCKSLGGILGLQEKVTTQWKALREPVAAEVFEPEPVAAEVIPADVVAEEPPVEPLPVPAVPAAQPAPAYAEPSRAMAAFVGTASVPKPAEPKLHQPAPTPAAPPPAPAAKKSEPVAAPKAREAAPEVRPPVPAPVVEKSPPAPATEPVVVPEVAAFRAPEPLPVHTEPEPTAAPDVSARVEPEPSPVPEVVAFSAPESFAAPTEPEPMAAPEASAFSAPEPSPAAQEPAPSPEVVAFRAPESHPAAHEPEPEPTPTPEVSYTEPVEPHPAHEPAVEQAEPEPEPAAPPEGSAFSTTETFTAPTEPEPMAAPEVRASVEPELSPVPHEPVVEPSEPETPLVPEVSAWVALESSPVPPEPAVERSEPEPVASPEVSAFSAPEPDPAPTEPAEPAIMLDLSAPTPAPAAVEPVADRAAEAVGPTVPAEPAPAPTSGAEVLELDADSNAPEESAPAIDLAKSGPVEETFSLDLEDAAVEEVVEVVEEVEVVDVVDAVEEVEVVDEVEVVEVEEVAFTPESDDTPPTPKLPSQTLSGATAVPAARRGPALALATKPASGKRPPLKITLVRPGEMSPLK
jgi:Zn-dependent protease with chaperone function